MTRFLPISTLLVLSTFGCVTPPGVLEGGDDELGESDEGDESGSPLLAECLRGTDPFGGTDPGEFPVSACEMTCDEGWGHGAATIPTAWTLEFASFDADDWYEPIGVAARGEGDGVVVVSRRNDVTELLTVSSDGAVLGSTELPTSLSLEHFDARDGVLYLGYENHETLAAEIVAVDEFGEVLWSVPHSGVIRAIAANPGGGAIVGTDSSLTRLEADGSTAWTVPSISATGIEVAPNGSILVGGNEIAQLDVTKLILYSDEGEPIETIDVMGSSSRLSDLHFLDERRFYASGTEFGGASFDGSALVVDLDHPELGWVRESNRGLDSCEGDGVMVHGQPTADWLGETVMLPDGTLLAVGAEGGPARPDGEQGIQPRVLHFDREGEILAGDRGLWFGMATHAAVDGEGSVYVSMRHVMTSGFYLRKYLP
jgi:hypothetical protein